MSKLLLEEGIPLNLEMIIRRGCRGLIGGYTGLPLCNYYCREDGVLLDCWTGRERGW